MSGIIGAFLFVVTAIILTPIDLVSGALCILGALFCLGVTWTERS